MANKVVQFMIARRRRGVVERRQAQLGGANLLFFTEQHRVVQGVFQLTNITRPRIVHQPGQRLRRQTQGWPAEAAGIER